jgi:hypothetical protein
MPLNPFTHEIPKPAARPQCASCRASGQGAYCSACPRTAWEEYATSDDGLAEYDAVKQRARVKALEALMDELEQSLNTIEFLYGCLTEPAVYKHAYPSITAECIEHLRKIVGPRNYCVHSNTQPGCPSCQEGARKRARRAEDLAALIERERKP